MIYFQGLAIDRDKNVNELKSQIISFKAKKATTYHEQGIPSTRDLEQPKVQVQVVNFDDMEESDIIPEPIRVEEDKDTNIKDL